MWEKDQLSLFITVLMIVNYDRKMNEYYNFIMLVYWLLYWLINQ